MNKTRIFLLVAFVVAAIASVGFFAYSLEASAEAQAQADLAAAQEEEKIRSEAESRQAAIQKTASEATGVLTERVENDEEILQKVARLFSNWSSYDEYTANRKALIEEWGVPEDSSVVVQFMPPIEALPDQENNGELVNIIDKNKWHSDFISIEPYVIGQEGDKYQYFCIVSLSTSNSGGSTAEGKCAMTCDVSSSGEISNLSVISLAG